MDLLASSESSDPPILTSSTTSSSIIIPNTITNTNTNVVVNDDDDDDGGGGGDNSNSGEKGRLNTSENSKVDSLAETTTKTPTTTKTTISVQDIVDEVTENEINKIISKTREAGSMSPQVKDELKDRVRLMKREDIENLILEKIIESIKAHSSVSSLHTKLMDAMSHKDKLFHRVNNLHRQVTELTKAVRSMSENVGRQKTNGKNVQPIRFYRSVGLQVTYDSPLKPVNENNIINGESILEPSRRSVLKQGNHHINNHQLPPSLLHSSNLNNNSSNQQTPPTFISQKRPFNGKPVVSVADVSKQVEIENQNKMRKLSNTSDVIEINGTTTNNSSNNVSPSKLLLQQQQNAGVNPNNRLGSSTTEPNKARKVGGEVVDLTDDETFPYTNNNSTNNNPTTTTTNTVNLSGQQVMVVQSPGGNYQILTPGNQPRPILSFTASNAANATKIVNSLQQPRGVNPLIVRGMLQQQQNSPNNIIITNNGQILMKPMAPLTKQNSTAIRLPNNSSVGSNNSISNQQLIRPPVQNVMQQRPLRAPGVGAVDGIRKFVLPPLPPPSIIGNPRRCSKDIPPRPDLTLAEQKEGIVLSWTLKINQNHAEIQTYQIYACQEPLVPSGAAKAASWKKVGDVKALPLPMACTLSQFADENRYHFIVRGVDVYNRTGPFCEVTAITLKKKLQQ